MPTPLDLALASFEPSHVTVRVTEAMFGVLGTPLAGYRSLAEAATALHGDAAAGILDAAQAMANGPEGRDALALSQALDCSDTGITITTGLATALSFVWGQGPGGLRMDGQQRTDAALKGLAIGWLVHRLLPGPFEARIRVLEALPAGRALLRYYGAIEAALPFTEEVIAAGGKYLAGAIDAERGTIVPRLLPIAGKDGVIDAVGTLPALVPVLDRYAAEGVQSVGPLAEIVRGYLPSVIHERANLADIAATAADTLPIYRWLLPRVAVEAFLYRAREAAEPGWTLVTPEAPAPVADTNPFATPLVEGAAPPAPAPAEASPAAPEPAPTEPAPAATPPTERKVPRLAPRPARPTSPEPPGPSLASVRTATPTLIADAYAGEDAEDAEDAAPAVPAARPSPRKHDVGEPFTGAFVRMDGDAELWVVFTRDGTFASAPPRTVPPDWDGLRRLGARVGRYHRRGSHLIVTFDDGTSVDATLEPTDYHVRLDGRPAARADWDLTGRHLAGTWGRGARRLVLTAAGGVTDEGGRRGVYQLGPSAVELRWSGGVTEQVPLLTDLQPHPVSPHFLWIAGERWERA